MPNTPNRTHKTRQMLRAKIHRIAVTQTDVAYEGSLTLDADLMRAADLLPFEKLEVYDVDNGSRFATYVIEGQAGSGDCCVNGAAARLVQEGDKLILAAYAAVDEREVREHRPRVVLIGEGNHVTAVKDHESAGVRVAPRAAS
jgi:aspartate 1-decarboxylase